MISFLENIDRQLFLLINGANSIFFDNLMWIVSWKYTWLPLYLLFIYLFIKYYKKKSWLFIIGAIVSVAIADFTSVHLFKEIFQRYRPCHNLELEGMIHLVRGYCGGKYGFISSHAANTSAIAVFVLFFMNKKTDGLTRQFITFALIFWTILIAYSRIYLGVHYPSDVFAGIIWGAFIALVLAFIIKHSLRILGNIKIINEFCKL